MNRREWMVTALGGPALIAAEKPLARPTPEQRAWQDMELEMFIHFGPATWQDAEYDRRSTPLERINPAKLDAEQWVEAAKSMGAGQLIFVAKHTGGFCWWQTETSNYTVKETPWRGGKGDVMRDLARLCPRHGIKLGVYLSPADAVYKAKVGGRCATPEEQEKYSAVYRRQLTELLSRYGEIAEVWFDGSSVIDVGDILRRYAPHAMVFQSKYATIRWVGNEDGYAPYPAWNAVPEADARSGVATAKHGSPDGDIWMPLECDARIRKTWFWNTRNADTLKTAGQLMEMYYRSVGHGAVLLLNNTPDTSGLIPEADVKRTAEFGAEIRRRFGKSLAETKGTGDTVELNLRGPRKIEHVVTMESIGDGERVREYVVEGFSGGAWKELSRGTAVGHKKIDRVTPAELSRVRFRSLRSAAKPLIRKLAVYSMLLAVLALGAPARAGEFEVAETADSIRISGSKIDAEIRKRGYVSGVAAGSFIDKTTGFRDAGFGLDIVDWIMEPGSDEAYRDRLPKELRYDFNNPYHGKRAKRSIEGPQICTRAKEVSPQVVRGKDFVAVKTSFRYNLAAPGKKTGSEWQQVLVFPAGKRYFVSMDKITAVNSSEAMFLRIDMPGHIKHKRGDTFSEVYLSYAGRIPSSAFLDDFAPDARNLYVREAGKVPKRFIRAYRLRDPATGREGPWLAGMTLDPSVVSEAWCHQRGYVCMIEEFGGRPIRPGQSFSAAFIVGYFDSVEEMERVYDQYAGNSALEVNERGWRLTSGGQAGPEPWLAKRLEWFQDLRFGLFMHWGAYSQMGCIESWPLVWADRKWSNPAIKTREEMIAFREKYFGLNRTFNPTAFDPKSWAKLAKRAGMKYVVFTTKHHDGFSMFDTRMTDYRVTSPEVPFSKDPRANIALEVFRAFRAEGFGIGAYFSKSDWHSPYYWSPERFAEDRNPNYDTAAEPDRWARFVDFVHGQIGELMKGYGKIDILWLDGGQVRPPKQDIQMDRLAAMARGHQPGLIIVNRTARDRYEDYRTPEQEVPDKPLDYVWESCLTMGKQWSYKPDDQYKSTRELIHLLVDIVSKGGNLLLNIGPGPDGTLPPQAVSRLEEIGDWMSVNAEAIHGTRPIAPYKEGRVALTRKGKHVYAIYLASDTEPLPASLTLTSLRPAAGSAVRLLGSNARLRWRTENAKTVIDIPEPVRSAPPSPHALVFKLEL